MMQELPRLLRFRLVFFILWFSPAYVDATPLIALREAKNCGGCHNPGRGQRPVLERRCTLDCQGCHIDPSGAGPRNQWGYYYSQDQLAAVNFFKPQDPLKDQSRIDFHYDGRVIFQEIEGGASRTFPMSSEFGVRVRPFVNYLHLTYQNLLLGKVSDKQYRVVEEGDRRFREKYSVMVDSLPLNTYVRAYRGTPMYGLRRPNHTAWIRQRLDLDQFATTEAVEVGGTPNVPFFRVSKMQGDPHVPEEYKQKGSTYHVGMRGVTLGWHVNGSGWKTASKAHEIDMHAFGAGLNAWQVLLYGERNWRHMKTIDADLAALAPMQPQPASVISEYKIAYAGIRGLSFGAVLEELENANLDSQRRSFFIDLHPIPFLQLEIWKREETGSRQLKDTLGVMHFFADF